MRLKDCNIAIVGLGLMGGSLAGALRTRGLCREVIGVARRRESIDQAQRRGFIDWGTTEIAEGVRDAQVVILATPVRHILNTISHIAALLPPNCILMDIGSTKSAIMAEMARLPEHIQPLGTHPMCGKEVAGLDAAEPTLYKDAPFVLTPLPRTSSETVAFGEGLACAIGARPMILDAQKHDRLVATVSHLPYLLAMTLVNTAESVSTEDARVWNLAAGGFRDTSRVAASEVTMMLDILLTNRAEVLGVLDNTIAQLIDVRERIERGDEEGLRAIMTNAQKRRENMFTQDDAPNDANVTIAELQHWVTTFRDERDWLQFHNPKDLAVGIVLETAELLEHFRFKTVEGIEQMLAEDVERRRAVETELAHVLWQTLNFASIMNCDLTSTLKEAIAEAATRYPVEKARGNASKYTEL